MIPVAHHDRSDYCRRTHVRCEANQTCEAHWTALSWLQFGLTRSMDLQERQYQVTGDTVRERYQRDTSVAYHIACCVMTCTLLPLPCGAIEQHKTMVRLDVVYLGK